MSTPLRNHRHEMFCANIAAGMTQAAAYRESGFHGKGSATACNLMKREDIKARIAELLQERQVARGRDVSANADEKQDQADVIERTGQASSKWILRKLVAVAVDAHAKLDFNAATKALHLLGREQGMFAERLVAPSFDSSPRQAPRLSIDTVNDLLEKIGFEGAVDFAPQKART